MTGRIWCINSPALDFPGSPMVKNLPAYAGDVGSISGPGRPHVPRNNKA